MVRERLRERLSQSEGREIEKKKGEREEKNSRKRGAEISIICF